ncbi:MAG: DUF2849 domain-containing protein [Pseudomonadales bacterium]|jgi:hypothetical protein
MKLITANHLKTGRVIYYRASPEGWTADPAAATALPDAVAETRLEALEAAPGDALGPYLIPLSDKGLGGQKWRREALRHRGPSAGTTLRLHEEPR